MSACVSCSTELDPLWNYCVGCGTPVVRVESIPGAIRPEQPSATVPSRILPRSALLVIVLAVVGVIGSFFAAAAVLR